jgi:hypothetical protein
VLWNPLSDFVFCTGYDDNRVTLVDGRGDTAWMTIAVGGGPVALAHNTVQNRVYAANYLGSSISVIRDLVGISETSRPALPAGTPEAARLLRAGAQFLLEGPAQLLDVSGRRLRSLKPGDNPTAGWAPGLYFLKQTDRPLRKLLVVR